MIGCCCQTIGTADKTHSVKEYLYKQMKHNVPMSPKQQHQLDRQRHREMKHHTSDLPAVDCACVIHGSVYSWDYVERLYSMLIANSNR